MLKKKAAINSNKKRVRRPPPHQIFCTFVISCLHRKNFFYANNMEDWKILKSKENKINCFVWTPQLNDNK